MTMIQIHFVTGGLSQCCRVLPMLILMEIDLCLVWMIERKKESAVSVCVGERLFTNIGLFIMGLEWEGTQASMGDMCRWGILPINLSKHYFICVEKRCSPQESRTD